MFHQRFLSDQPLSDAAYTIGARALQVGDVFPDIWTDSTDGELELHSWARGNYTIVFTHAAAYSDVSAADMVALSEMRDHFAARGVKLLGLAQTDATTERLWLDDLSAQHETDIDITVMADEDGRIAEICGLVRDGDGPQMPKGKTFVIGPDLRILAVSAYPAAVPRSPWELLRIVEAVQDATA